jgi:hypothetical protein
MNSRFRSAEFIIARFTAAAMKPPGGPKPSSIPLQSPAAFGSGAASVALGLPVD